MIEQWFKQDIESHLVKGKRAVVCDANGDGAFLLGRLKQVATVFVVSKPIEEIQYRYEAEKHYTDKNVVFYATMPKSQLTFLQEYAQVDGLVDLTDLDTYIKGHLFAETGVNATISKAELIMAAKLSMGKDLNWWKGVATGITRAFDMQDCLFDFVCDPENYLNTLDLSVRDLFVDELYKTIRKPKVKQTNAVMAKEVMTTIFDGLASNNISDFLFDIYKDLADKTSVKPVMAEYLNDYTVSVATSPLTAHPDHPFDALDDKLMLMLSDAIKNDTDTSACLHAISRRINSKNALSYKAEWLKDLLSIFQYSSPAFHKATTLSDFAILYQNGFAKIDNAMRTIYVAWLNKPDVLRPIQYYYEQLSKAMLDKWFMLVKDYQPTQNSLVVNALQKNGRVAVIVGDGLRLEIAEEVASLCKTKDSKYDNTTAFAMLPSVTENGMSALYGCNGVEHSAQNRFATLKTYVPETVVMALDALNDSVTAEKLVLTFGDIDQIGEKKQLTGLKDICNYTALLVASIKQLLAMGYNRVYLTADHGFVITGILDEADKIPVPSGLEMKVGERFVLSNDQLHDSSLIERIDRFDGYAYQYYARTDKPFVSRGSYGYAHGGLTPQECIIPMYCFSKDNGQEGCTVCISNKNDLKSVTGSYFTAKIKAIGDSSTLFSSSRKIKLQLFDSHGKSTSATIHTINAGDTLTQEFEIPSTPCKLVITDKDTTEQLDSCEIGKSSVRDIDDLF